MANLTRNFTQGKMNKMVDERLIPDGQYVDALNVRMGSTEGADIGVIENSKGNEVLTAIGVDGTKISPDAKCIGAFEDGALETIYWMIHDPNFIDSNTGKLDLIVSFNTNSSTVTYHVISKDDGGGVNTTLNFNEQYLFTGVNKVEDLLFFTDDYNPPRRINVKKNYPNPNVSGIDGFDYKDILVIKQPPLAAPGLEMQKTSTEETFLDERFICFGYRYRYEDEQYSATSQFTDPAFTPDAFLYSPESYLNEGVENIYDTALVTFNTGGPLVVGIDLLFKEANSPVIKIIEKLNKTKQGYADYQDVTYTFTNSKIFTILPEAEILRLYDNVPLLSKAQTTIGNRLMYGNYVEGYDLIDKNNSPVRLDFVASGLEEAFDIGSVGSVNVSTDYLIGGAQTIAGSAAQYDFSSFDLVKGSSITIEITFDHNSFSGPATPTETNVQLVFQYTFNLVEDYASVYDWAQSAITTAQVGTSLPGGNIEPIATRDQGTTMTDLFNQLFKNDLDNTYFIYQSGITAIEQAIILESTVGSDDVTFRFPAVQYADDVNTPTVIVTEYFDIASGAADYSKLSSGQSLHSNRGYEIGIIYMDEFNRSTTALVSQYNTVQFPCGASDTANSIIVNIPTTQVAPKWAKNYKYAIKPDRESYETIYSSIFFTDPIDSNTYFLLEGENSQKITNGQRLIVKRDTLGATSSCDYATVLEKASKSSDFIAIPSPSDPTVNLNIPSGVYMKMKANSFSVEGSENAIIDYGSRSDTSEYSGFAPVLSYPLYIYGVPDPTIPGSTVTEYSIPASSRIVISYEVVREGGIGCDERIYNFNSTLVSPVDYNNFRDWFLGENVIATLNTGNSSSATNPPFIVQYVSGFQTPLTIPTAEDILYIGFEGTVAQPGLNLLATGTLACGGSKKRRSKVSWTMTVFRAEDTIVFESEPLDAAPDIWYESSKTFGLVTSDDICNVSVLNQDPNDLVYDYTDINGLPQQITVPSNPAPSGSPITFVAVCSSVVRSAATPPTNPANVTLTSTSIPSGTHLGDIQNQILSTGQPAICDTGFFNCYSFGNGVESYKIRDSILGKDFNLGNRVTSTQAQDYREVRRFADITYSGVYSDESNVNKLNEFNGGLLNFKPLEESFGPIQILHGREKDVLTLQEDKISYVLTGANILSDAGAGNLLLSVPEVLGNQIARIEEFGISHNPESFSSYGDDRYFTDAKRGVVLKLSGASYNSDRLEVISSLGMRTWFRDLFLVQFETQKLGGFDPYMNEYVLSSNQDLVPMPKACINCGISKELKITSTEIFDECFEMGSGVGDVDITWTVAKITGTFDVDITYNGVTTSLTNQTASGSQTINKNVINTTEVSVTITPTDIVEITLDVECPDAKEITVIEVIATSADDATLTFHSEYRYMDGTFISPLTSSPIQFAAGTTDPVVTRYNSLTGIQGQGSVPPDGSNVVLAFNKFQSDTANFDNANNSFRYLRTATNYPNTASSVSDLIAASTGITPNLSGQPDYIKATFTMPPGNDGDYLYLIWDLRNP